MFASHLCPNHSNLCATWKWDPGDLYCIASSQSCQKLPQVWRSHRLLIPTVFSSPWVMRTWVPVIRKLWLLHCHTVTNAALLPGTVGRAEDTVESQSLDFAPSRCGFSTSQFTLGISVGMFGTIPRLLTRDMDICRQKDHKPWSRPSFCGLPTQVAASPRHSLHWECLGRSLDFVASPSHSLQCFTLGVFRTPASLHLEGGGGKPSL